MLTRRMFVQILSAASSGAVVLADSEPPAESVPALPQPPHPKIPISHPLFLSFENPRWGRVLCSKWVLNENGVFCNQEPIFPAFPLLGTKEARKIYFQDPAHLWVMLVLPAFTPVKIVHHMPMWEAGELRITPRMMDQLDGGDSALMENYIARWMKP